MDKDFNRLFLFSRRQQILLLSLQMVCVRMVKFFGLVSRTV